MSDIPEEFITKILTRLPVKSLLRFRCVCKRWHGLIDSQRFIKLHLNQTLKSNPDPKLLLSGVDLYLTDIGSIFGTNIAEIENIDPPGGCLSFGVQVIGCCNGLVCLDLTRPGPKKIVLLWNPSTRKFREVPDFVNPYSFVIYAGFGYDAINDDYKVVKIMGGKPFPMLHVYSLRSNSLMKVEAFPYCCITIQASAAYVAGCLHFKVLSDSGVQGKGIVAFNLTTETTQFVPLPDCSLNAYFEINLAALDGQLCLIYNYNDEYAADIWIMKHYGQTESWTKIATIFDSGYMDIHHLCPISFSKSGKQLLLGRQNQEFVCYDLEEESAEDVELQGHLGDYLQYGVYSGSLVQLNNFSRPTANKRGHGSTQQKKAGKRDNFLSTGFKLVL